MNIPYAPDAPPPPPATPDLLDVAADTLRLLLLLSGDAALPWAVRERVNGAVDAIEAAIEGERGRRK